MAHDPRVAELVHRLQLVPHPEGGWYREVFRSAKSVTPSDGRSDRAALTSIYFLLAAGQVSRWHAIRSDEVWHHIEGAPLDLWLTDREADELFRETVGPFAPETEPVAVAPATWWQACRSTGAYTLAACTVGPGFDFEDFSLLADPGLAARVKKLDPEAHLFL